MKQVENRWLVTLLVVVVHITMAEQVMSQPTDRNGTLMFYACSSYTRTNEIFFPNNLNTTFSSLRLQLTTSGQGTAHALLNGASVWAFAWCRGYLSIPDCLDCFDYGVDQLKQCGISNGAQVTYTDCDVRYENYNFFSAVNNRASIVLCDNTTAPQPKEFRKAAERLLLDLRIAASRATNIYAASTMKVAVDNATVYAIAQCNLNARQSVCLECLKLRSRSLYDCLPATSGRATTGLGCFVMYDRAPIFRQNQTTDIASLLWDGASEPKGAGYYHYKHLELATNNFSEENIIGKGGFGEVFKAIFDDKKVVAVKKLKVGYAGAKIEFENEILLISQIRHRNLLGLHGWSSEGSNLLLVLEYMPNGSLDKFLWAPQYILYGHLSEKVDTFSFSIVILEIISGRKCTYRNFDGSSTGLLEFAWKLYETKNLMKLVDETMDVNQYETQYVMNIIEIALLCTQSPVSKRPTMFEVVLMLQNDQSLAQRQLTRPTFIDHDWSIQTGSSRCPTRCNEEGDECSKYL
ncbi:hypothetical protein L1987_45464 [Smallanthus sonchifolius]|uniref:Uncharacterized protein n=1 Tax=Smallanthus sonchifolius TaxID=185202 RepID=A0ACB9FX44_9ASTR|nr:hypothetical protein L1987_45464 [Smallanthus sonchifolius]